MDVDKGSLDPVNDALNKPTIKAGIDYRLFLGCLVIGVAVFLFHEKLAALLIFIALYAIGAILTKEDPAFFELWILRTFRQSAYYDPAKED